MVEKELQSHTSAVNISLPMSESMDYVFEDDFSAQKTTKAPEKEISNLD